MSFAAPPTGAFDVRYLISPLNRNIVHIVTMKDFIFRSGEADVFMEKLRDMIHFLLPYYVREGKNQLVIAVGCTGGHHRSVAVAQELYQSLQGHTEYGLKIFHRDIPR